MIMAGLMTMGRGQETIEFTSYFNGGLPFCSQCGTPGQYACSPDSNGQTLGQWNNGVVNFVDPVPAGNHITAVRVTLHGAWSCNPEGTPLAMFGVTLNGIIHGVRESTKGANKCKCDTCDTFESFSFPFRNTIPGYKYRASNSLKIDLYSNSICVNRVIVAVDYKPIVANSPLPQSYVSVDIPSGLDAGTCGICNSNKRQWCSKSGNNSVNIGFNDPLPTGVVVVGAELYYSYGFSEKCYNNYYSTLFATLQGVEIGNARLVDTSFRSKCGCYGDSIFNSVFYQRGWPSYNYKGKNDIRFSVSKYTESQGNICIGRIGINLLYYSFNETSTLTGIEKIEASTVILN